MASTVSKAIRRSAALARLSASLGIEQADLTFNGRGDPELSLVITLERLADAVDERMGAAREVKKVEKAKQDADAPLTVETVEVVPVTDTASRGKRK